MEHPCMCISISTLREWMLAIRTRTHTIALAPPLSSRWLDVSSPDGSISNKIKIICASKYSVSLIRKLAPI